jgi:hypothetical protein
MFLSAVSHDVLAGTALYFCWVTMSSIGYGDYYPVTRRFSPSWTSSCVFVYLHRSLLCGCQLWQFLTPCCVGNSCRSNAYEYSHPLRHRCHWHFPGRDASGMECPLAVFLYSDVVLLSLLSPVNIAMYVVCLTYLQRLFEGLGETPTELQLDTTRAGTSLLYLSACHGLNHLLFSTLQTPSKSPRLCAFLRK